MRIKSNPKRNIRLFQLKDCQKGFISVSDVIAISGDSESNFAINMKASVYTIKSDINTIPVFGTGDARLDFEIDLSSFVVGDIIDVKNLESGENYDWYKVKIDVLENVLSYDDSDYGDDEFFEDFYDDWLICSEYERKSLVKEIKDFLLREADSSEVNEILLDRTNTIKSIRLLGSDASNSYSYDSDSENDDFRYNDYSDNFYNYNSKEKKLLLELFKIKLDFINTYLLSSDNWQSLPKSVFLSIRDYMVERERFEILFKPAKFFANTNKKV